MPRLDWDDEAFDRIVYKVRDYAVGSGVDEERLARWVQLGPKDMQVPLLLALDHFTEHHYLSRKRAKGLVHDLLRKHLFNGSTVFSYMQRRLEATAWFDIQGRGSSQHRVLEFVDEVLDECCKGLTRSRPDEPSMAVYIDDCSFTGTTTARTFQDRNRNGLTHAVSSATHLVVLHLLAYEDRQDQLWFLRDWDADQRPDVQAHAGWVVAKAERLRPKRTLRATVSREVGAYWDSLSCSERAFHHSGALSDINRADLVVRDLLERGVALRGTLGDLRDADRPLGFTREKDFGFGSPVVTYGNCPNTAPLALWAGKDALFPRKNRHTP